MEQHVRAGGHQQVGVGGEVCEVDQIALVVKDGALLEPGAHLVHADYADVSAGVHRPGRELIVEGEVRAPCLVDDDALHP